MNKEHTQTIVYGGAFNPPTNAHQAILQACIEYATPREGDVWLLPSASRVDKTIETPAANRIKLCEALAHDVVQRTARVRVDTTELFRSAPTETYDTVREFAGEYPDRDFTWVFGEDSLATMQAWRGGEWMYDNLSMLVVPRPGSRTMRLGRCARRLSIAPSSGSSTEVRERIAAGEAFDDLVGPEVYTLLTARL